MHQKCRKRLSTGKICQVEACNCGVVHLRISGVTLHLDQEAFEDLYNTLLLSVQHYKELH